MMSAAFLLIAFVFLFLLFWGLFYVSLPGTRHALHFLAARAAALSTRYARFGALFTRARERATPLRAYGPVILIVTVGLGLILWAGSGFIDVAELVHEKSPVLQAMDGNAHNWAVTHRTPTATTFFVAATNFGGPVCVSVIVAVTAIFLASRKRYGWAAYILGTAGGGGLIDFLLKTYFARARPDLAEMLRHARGYAFPSGHAMGSTVAFLALAYFVVSGTWTWPNKAAVLALACTLIVTVALSRVYLGAHWLSDVGAGVTAGVIWVAVTTTAFETFRRIHAIRVARHEAAPSADPV